jgi:hypothetical protein
MRSPASEHFSGRSALSTFPSFFIGAGNRRATGMRDQADSWTPRSSSAVSPGWVRRLVPGQGTNQKGTGATSFATRTRAQRDVLSPPNALDSPKPLAGSGGLIVRWSLVRVQPAPRIKPLVRGYLSPSFAPFRYAHSGTFPEHGGNRGLDSQDSEESREEPTTDFIPCPLARSGYSPTGN